MKTLMRRCTSCWTYTFKSECPECGSDVMNPLPARYSPQDRWGKYRRKLKQLSEEE